MYIRRDIDNTLLSWKNSTKRKPLLLRGVRQCGKTTAVRNLAKSFHSFVEINLEKQPGLRALFEGDIDIPRIISRLELTASIRIIPGETLLFIDEIQECPRAVTVLRYFYEELPELHLIAAGSLLEFVLNSNRSKIDFPVGRVRSIYLYPFDFKEFLRGLGHEVLCDYLESPDIHSGENIAHTKLLQLYKSFLIVGGMPEAVAEFAESGSYLACQQVHRDIIRSFQDDFNKYSPDIPAEIIRKVFDFAIHNICCQTKSSSAITGVSAYYFDESLNLLKRAGLVYPVLASSCDTIPLGASARETGKKLLFFDSGIYLTMNSLDAADLLDADTFDRMNKGDIVEMQTGLEMIKYSDPYTEPELFYWYRTRANAEVDYVLQQKTSVIPIEVKASGKGSMQSMYSFLNAFPDTPYGIRISLENFTSFEKIRVCPVYAVSHIINFGHNGL